MAPYYRPNAQVLPIKPGRAQWRTTISFGCKVVVVTLCLN